MVNGGNTADSGPAGLNSKFVNKKPLERRDKATGAYPSMNYGQIH